MWRRVSCEQQLDMLFLSVEEIRVFQARACEPVCQCRETGALRARSFAQLRGWRSVRSWSAVFLLSSVSQF